MPNGDPLLIGRQDNNATQETRLIRNDDGTSRVGLTVQQGPNASGTGISGISTDAEGVRGQSTEPFGAGVHGVSTFGAGVVGETIARYGVFGVSVNGHGVAGHSENMVGVVGYSKNDVGVWGIGDSDPGVVGKCSGQPGVVGSSTKNSGVYGYSPTLGVRGLADSRTELSIGVAGECSAGGYGVYGTSPSGAGVYGADVGQDGSGVYGTSDNGWGVRGESGGQAGVYGEGYATTSAYGVWGNASRSLASGVFGDGRGSAKFWTPAGVEGRALSGPGVFARTVQGDFGLIAVSAATGGAGRFTVRNSGHGMGAAAFGGDVSVSGGVYVEGPLKVFGNPKSAVVRLPDGSHRLLYCMESPESWFEDFGRGRLVRGKAKVTLDRTFAAVVRTNDYHVFLSSEGESGGIYVSRRTRTGFEVREQGGGRSTVRFSYRIVARRKDVTAPRFPKEASRPISSRRPSAVASTKVAARPTRLKRPILPKVSDVPKRAVTPKLLERFTLRIARRRRS